MANPDCSPPTPESQAATSSAPPRPEVMENLVASHREFLSFLQARLPSRAIAEELLQSAFVRTLEKGGDIVDPGNAVAWFYRLLRNALVDYYRHKAVEVRAHEKQTQDQLSLADDALLPAEPELRTVICTCINTLLPNLKPDYAAILQRVDLQEIPISQAAAELGLTNNNATVRLHRARQALKQELERSCGTCTTHGCLDCTCSVG